MKIVIASDHAGFDLKLKLIDLLKANGREIEDLGTYSRQPADYPDFAEAVGLAIRTGRAERGILICGSGVGVSVAANKIPGIRAAVCHDSYSAHQGVEHDNMNVLVLGSRVVALNLASELALDFLNARFMSNVERYVRRLDKIAEMERRYSDMNTIEERLREELLKGRAG